LTEPLDSGVGKRPCGERGIVGGAAAGLRIIKTTENGGGIEGIW